MTESGAIGIPGAVWWGAPALLFAAVFLTGCDEVPGSPEIPDRLRVGVVTSRLTTAEGSQWFVYEIDQEGTVEVVIDSELPLLGAHYTSFLGTQGSIAYLDADSNLTVHHLESGNEISVGGPFSHPRFSASGTMVAFSGSVSDDGGEALEQVFVLDRLSGQVAQVTENECAGTGEVPDPCAFSSSRPVFGSEDELYMVRKLRNESGEVEDALSVITTRLFEQHYIVVPEGTRSIYPNSVFQGSLVAGYVEQEGTPDEVRGFYAINLSTGGHLEYQMPMRDAGFCFDATIMGVDGTELRVVDIGGNAVGEIPLPAEYGQEILSVECSLQPKNIIR